MPGPLGTALAACSLATPFTAGAEAPWLGPTFGTVVGATVIEPHFFVSFPPPFLTLDLAIAPTSSRTGFRSIPLPLLSGSARTSALPLGESGILLEALATASSPLSSRKRVSSRAIDAIKRASSSSPSTADGRLHAACLSGFCLLRATSL